MFSWVKWVFFQIDTVEMGVYFRSNALMCCIEIWYTHISPVPFKSHIKWINNRYWWSVYRIVTFMTTLHICCMVYDICSGLILGLRPANDHDERRCYFVTTSLIGWAQICYWGVYREHVWQNGREISKVRSPLILKHTELKMQKSQQFWVDQVPFIHTVHISLA